MFINLIRLFIIYFFTVFSFRLMGKRQVGELQLSELVCAIFISELATAPIGDISTPLIYGIIPIVFLVSCEVIISFLSIKIPFFKKIFDSKPDILINKGEINPKALTRSRMTVEELLSELRQQSISSISEVQYAILEANGKVSVLPKSNLKPLTPSDMNIQSDEEGLERAIIIDGKVNSTAMKSANKSEKWLHSTLKKEGFKSVDEIFLLTVCDNGKIFYVRKNK